MTGKWLPLALAALALATRLPAQLGESEIREITIEPSVGLDERNQIIPDTFNPFHIVLTNTLADFQGTLEVEVTRAPEYRARQMATLIYTEPLELPLGSRKAVDGLFFCPEDETEIEVRLRDAEGRVVTSSLCGFGRRQLERRIVLAVTPETGKWDQLRTPEKTVSGIARQVLRCAPERFPGHWLALAPVTTVLWDGDRWPAMDAQVGEALRVWIEQGGTLAVGTGPGWQMLGDSPLEPLLPLSISGTEIVASGEAEGRLPLPVTKAVTLASLAASDMPASAEVWATLHGHPLLFALPRGRGHIVVCTAQLSALWSVLPTDERDQLAALIVPPGERPLPEGPRDPALDDIQRSVASFTRIQVPRAEVIGRWLLVLWVIMVPANFSLAWLVRRPRLAWGLAPFLAIGATAFVWNRGLMGALPFETVQQTQIITCPQDSRVAEARGIVSIFAPVEDSYTLTFAEPGLALTPLLRGGRPTGVTERYLLRAGRAAGLVDHPIGYQTLRSFAELAELPNPVEVHLTGASEGSEAVVSWDGGLDELADQWFAVWQGQAYEIPPASLRSAGSLGLRASEGKPLPELVGTPLQTGTAVDVPARVLASLGPTLAREAMALGPICLIGVRRGALVPVRVHTARRPQRSEGARRAGTAVLLAPVEVGPLLPRPWSQHVWNDWDLQISTPSPYLFGTDQDGSVTMPANSDQDATVVFHPRGAGWQRIEPRELSLLLGLAERQRVGGTPNRGPAFYGGPAGETQIHVALFNWSRLTWAERSGTANQPPFAWDDAEEFLHPLTGEVLAALWVTQAIATPADTDQNVIRSGFRTPWMGVKPPVPDASELEIQEPWHWWQGPERERRAEYSDSTWRVQLRPLEMQGPLRERGAATP